MAIIRDQAVVLGRVDYSETSQVLVFFTREHGKVRAIAKGIKRGTKKRFAVGADLLDAGYLCVSSRQERGAGLATVTEWKQGRPHSGFRESLSRIHAGQYVAEITVNLTEDWDAHAQLFDALARTLADLSEASQTLPFVLRYQYLLLEASGSLPRLGACVLCGRDRELTFFSSFEGGMLCKHCEPGRVEKREVSGAALERLRSLDAPVTETSSQEHADVGAFDVLDYHISHLMGRAPRMAGKLVSAERRRLLG
jgi:DNA repair protein RecO (recombination protein O)